MKFLIVTPTYDGKQYCDTQWAASVNSQIGNNMSWKHIVVDTSATAGYRSRLVTLLPNSVVVRRAALAGIDINPLILAVHVEARDYFLNTATDCDAYISWESDVIAPSDALFKMQQAMLWGIDLCMFSYPARDNINVDMAGLGFTAFSRALMTSLAWDTNGGYGMVDDLDSTVSHSPEGWFIRRAKRANFKVATVSNIVNLEHRNG